MAWLGEDAAGSVGPRPAKYILKLLSAFDPHKEIDPSGSTSVKKKPVITLREASRQPTTFDRARGSTSQRHAVRTAGTIGAAVSTSKKHAGGSFLFSSQPSEP